MQIRRLKHFVLGGMLLLFLTPSCVDKNYDLEDLDLTVSIGGENFGLQIGTTEKIYLREFLKVEDSDMLTTDENEIYWLKQDGEIDKTSVKVNAVAVDESYADIEPYEIYEKPAGMPSVPIDWEGSTGVLSGEFLLQNNDIPQEVKSISEIRLGSYGNQATVSLKLNVGGIIGIPSGSIDLTSIKMTFPKFLVVKNDMKTGENLTVVGDENVFTFNGVKTLLPNGYERVFTVELIDFSDDPLMFDGLQTLNVEGAVSIEAEISVSGVNSSNISDKLLLKPEIGVSQFTIKTIKGIVSPIIDVRPDNIVLNDIPDFLDDDDVILDLSDPRIYFTLNNPAGIPINLRAGLMGMKNNQPTMADSIIIGGASKPLILRANRVSTIIISKADDQTILGEKDTDPDIIYYKTNPDISTLIKRIPDEIGIAVNAHAQINEGELHTLELGHTYLVDMDYKFEMPLAFGKDLQIVYKETIDGWNEDIEDYELNKLALSANVVNGIPLELTLEGTAVDVNGNELTDITITVADNKKIEPCKVNGTPETTSININMEVKKEGAMKKLDGILLKIMATSNSTVEGLYLQGDQYLIFKDLHVKIPGGITMDLN